MLVQLNVTRVTRKSQVSRSAAPKSERPGVFEWVLEEVKYVAAEGNDRTYIEKDKKKKKKNSCKKSQSGMKYGGVSHWVEWAGDYYLCSTRRV